MHIQINPINGRKEYFSDYTNIGIASCDVCGTPWPDETATICQTCTDRAAKHAQARAEAAAYAAQLSKELVSIKRTELAKGFKFVATMSDGRTIVVRAKATRPYAFAAIHQWGVVSKFDGLDPRGFLTFHSKTPKPAGNWDQIIRTVPIDA